MGNLFNICNGYIFLWCLYSMQGILYAEGGMISQGILVILLGISFYTLVDANINYKLPATLKGLNVLLLLFTLYGIVMMLDGQEYYMRAAFTPVTKTTYLKDIYISLLPIYTFFIFTKKGLLSPRMIRVWVCIFVVLITLQYWQYYQDKLVEAKSSVEALDTTTIQEDFTNNVGYSFLALIPALFFFDKRKLLQFALLIYIAVYVIMSMKRGAIIVGAITLLWFIYRTFKTSSRRTKIWVTILISVAAIIMWQQISELYSSNELFQHRIEQTEEGGSSGRDIIYNELWSHYIDKTTLSEFLFGMGANGTLNVAFNYAHNDWLEIATNQGLLGLIIFAIFWIALFKDWRKAKGLPIEYSILGAIFIICFAKTFFSMSYNDIPFYMSICLGYCLAQLSSETDTNNLKTPIQ